MMMMIMIMLIIMMMSILIQVIFGMPTSFGGIKHVLRRGEFMADQIKHLNIFYFSGGK